MLHSKLKRFLNQKNGSFLVTGPPGTGKTHLLIETLLYLLNKKKIDPSRILVFCFNRRWAKILREKVAESVGRSIFEISITSFFSFCADFIEKMFYLKELNSDEKSETYLYNCGIKILNATQQWKLLKEVINGLKKENYPLTFKYIISNSFIHDSFTQEVFDFILRAQENLLSPIEISNKFTPFYNPVLSEIVGIYANYNEELLRRNLYNYGRLLVDTVNTLKGNEKIRNYFKQSYDFIIVDELQELNNAQFEIASYLSDSNLIFFGNDDECIYAFRGSMVNNFGRVIKKIYKNPDPDGFVLFLKTNLRSRNLINEVSNDFIDLNEGRISKRAFVRNCEAKRNGNINRYDSVVLKEFKTALDEIDFVSEQIKKFIVIKKTKPEEICILVKGLGYKTKLIENALTQNEILFTRRSSRTILGNINVQYTINFLKFITLLINEGKGNDLIENSKAEHTGTDKNDIKNKLLESILGSIFVGISPLFIKKMNSGRDNSLWESICSFNEKDLIQIQKNPEVTASNELSKLIEFKNIVNSFLKLVNSNVYDFVFKFLTTGKIGIIDFLLKDETISDFERESSLCILGDYLESLKDFSKDNPDSNSIMDYLLFLDDIAGNNFLEEIEESTKEVIKPGHINVLSYHHCKGLEFEVVFMPFINKNYLPASFGTTQLYDLQVFNYFSTGKILPVEVIRRKHLEDERNLFYTGMTRARSYLFITASKFEDSSIFFEEVSNIYGNLKKSAISKYKKLKKRQNILLHDSDKSRLFKYHEWLYSNPKNKWLIRKNVVSKTFKLKKSLGIDVENYLKGLSFLKSYYPYSQWWCCRNFTENKINPFLVIKPVFSYTSLSTYLECPYMYKLKNYFGLKEEKSLSLIIGSIYHIILKNFFKDNVSNFSWERLAKIINEVFKEFNFEFDHLKKEIHSKIVKDFKNYFNNCFPSYAIKTLIEKEFGFEFDGETVMGRIDQLNFLEGDIVELIDFKSGVKKITGFYLENEVQLRLYRLAVDLSPEMEFIKNKKYILKYIFLGDEHNQIYKLSDEFYNFEVFNSFLKNIIKEIKNEKFEAGPQVSYSCRDCDFNIVCPNKNAK